MRNVLVFVSIIGLTILSCGKSSPADVVNGVLDALDTADSEAMIQYLPAHERMDLENISNEDREMLSDMYDAYADIDVLVLVSEIQEDDASVTVEVTYMGETNEEEIELLLEDGNWVVPSAQIRSILSVAGNTPEDAVTGMFDALKAGDIDGMMQYMPESEREEVTDEMKEEFEQLAGIFEAMEFEVQGSEINGETAVVMVNITFMGETAEEEIELMKENGSWVVSPEAIF